MMCALDSKAYAKVLRFDVNTIYYHVGRERLRMTSVASATVWV